MTTEREALDRDPARKVLADYHDDLVGTEDTLDALARCVRPAAIDRDPDLRTARAFPCPTCAAQVGEPCRDPDGLARSLFHLSRSKGRHLARMLEGQE